MWNRTFGLAAASAAISLQLVSTASAQPSAGQLSVIAHKAAQEGVRAKVVSFADLDLSKEAGARTLLRRIRSAARDVCGPEGRELAERGFHTCFRRAISGAVMELDNPVVVAVYEGSHPAA